ncbi:hypothetical protein HDZ31DRAFT_29318 [Schizophyllum fasciatum]
MSGKLSPAAVKKLQAVIMQVGLEFIFYGIHLTLFIVAMVCIARRPTNTWVMPTVTILIFLTVSAWTFADLHLIVREQLALQRNPFVVLKIIKMFKHVNIMEVAMVRINFILCDFVVVWRAWIVWTGNKYVHGVLILCLVASIACSVADFVITYHAIQSLDIYGPAKTRVLLDVVPLLVTNIVASVLVGVKVWDYRRTIKRSLGQRSRTRVEKVMMLLVESGLIYAALWILYLVLSLTNLSNFQNSVGPLFVVWRASLSLVGLYSTIVIIIVSTWQAPTFIVGSNGKSVSSMSVSQPIKLRTFSTSASNSSAGEYSSAGTQSRSYDFDTSTGTTHSRAGPERSNLGTVSSETLRTPRASEDDVYLHEGGDIWHRRRGSEAEIKQDESL